MPKSSAKSQNSSDITLKHPPLIEAWLDIRWQLEPVQPPQMMRDPGFPFALGAFYERVKDKYSYKKDLEASKAPIEMLPYVVRHQFRRVEDGWPLLQLGPGVASVNFHDPYTWKEFEKEALDLRSSLSKAYGEFNLKTRTVNLRYRNAEPFDYNSDDLRVFLKENLNTSIELPAHIPGAVSPKDRPIAADIRLNFDLEEPKGTGALRLTTGLRKLSDPEVEEVPAFIWELGVASSGNDAPALDSEDEFSQWLNAAHDVIHEWFLSLVQGPLHDKYMGQGE